MLVQNHGYLPQPKHKRFLSDRPRNDDGYLRGASTYVENLPAENHGWLYRKPYATTDGNAAFYVEIYSLLNSLRAMDLPTAGRILEVGSGPGWITEILMMLGFEVDSLEPSADMIRIAQDRIAACRQHYRVDGPASVRFHQGILEECDLPDNTFDGILFHESLHHIIDEDAGLSQCFRMLVPGGVLALSCEGAWRPGNRELEKILEAAMTRFGTLENPFTAEYLDYLLCKHGFENVVRYHGVNGLFPVTQKGLTIEKASQLAGQFPASAYHSVTAHKPNAAGHPTTANSSADTRGAITIINKRLDPVSRRVRLTLSLRNEGETVWLHKPRAAGNVTLALRQGNPGAPDFREAEPRQRLPRDVAPGEELVFDVAYDLPAGDGERAWCLDLVNEGLFWFSSRGSEPRELRLY